MPTHETQFTVGEMVYRKGESYLFESPKKVEAVVIEEGSVRYRVDCHSYTDEELQTQEERIIDIQAEVVKFIRAQTK
jgi:hypothetical protein